jgi:glyoxylase-like metal-dependent hydrolase (beta-lactamase superfamily II)
VKVSELAPGLWRWTAPHPDWREGADWEREVGCVYYEAPDATVLIDPLLPPDRERFFEALDRDVERRGLPVTILLTCKWHARSATELKERYGADDATPAGIEACLVVPEIEETVWWLPEHGTLVAGDVLVGAPDGVSACPDSWLDEAPPAAIRAALRRLLELPVERVLVSHGEPVLEDGHTALERALSP